MDRCGFGAIPVALQNLFGVTALAGATWHSAALRPDSTNNHVESWGLNGQGQFGDGNTTSRYTPVAALGQSGVTALSSIGYENLALKPDNTVWA